MGSIFLLPLEFILSKDFVYFGLLLLQSQRLDEMVVLIRMYRHSDKIIELEDLKNENHRYLAYSYRAGYGIRLELSRIYNLSILSGRGIPRSCIKNK